MKTLPKHISIKENVIIIDSFEDAIKTTDLQNEKGWGISFVFVDKMEGIEQLPEHIIKYYNSEKEISYQEFESIVETDEECYVDHDVVHHSDWTEGLGVHENTRLKIVYTGYQWTDEEIELFVNKFN